MFKHYVINGKRSDCRNAGSYVEKRCVVSAKINSVDLLIKVQKGAFCTEDLYELCYHLVVNEREKIETSLLLHLKYNQRGTYVREGFSGCKDFYVRFQDETGFVHQNLVFHATMSGIVEMPSKEYGQENFIKIFLPDLFLVFMNEVEEHYPYSNEDNEKITRALNGVTSSDKVSEIKSWWGEPDPNAEDEGANLKEYAKYLYQLNPNNKPKEEVMEEKAEEIIGE